MAGVDAAGAGKDFLSYCPRITLSGVPICLIVMVTGMLISVVLPLMLATWFKLVFVVVWDNAPALALSITASFESRLVDISFVFI